MTSLQALIKLARECGAIGDFAVCFTPKELVRFHAKAQAQALRDAAKEFIGPVKAELLRMADELERKA